MPWHVSKNNQCPVSKPWAVIKDSGGSIAGCHKSQQSAHDQMAALYANDPGRPGMNGSNIMSDAERRFTSVPVEIRAGSDKRTIGGYAAKFDRTSQNLGGFVERITPGFFNKSRGDGWPGVQARYNHEDNWLLGTSAAGTLRLGLDEVGLSYEVDLPEHRGDVYELVQRGDVRQSSFAFIAYEDEWATNDQGFPLRTLISGRLRDVAPVNAPAYEDTSVGLRSLAEHFHAPLEEVRTLAASNDLVKFFKRTDGQPKPPARRSAAAALAKVQQLHV